jgi:hypothetical protein
VEIRLTRCGSPPEGAALSGAAEPPRQHQTTHVPRQAGDGHAKVAACLLKKSSQDRLREVRPRYT